MRGCNRTAWVVALVLGAAGLSAAADDDAKKEMEKLAGVWVPATIESNGTKTDATDEVVKQLRFVFKADGNWRLERDGKMISEGTYQLDLSKKPKQIDYKIEKSITESMKGTASLGIYELDGDMLKVCRTWPDNDKRPKEFAAGKDSKLILTDFKREKK